MSTNLVTQDDLKEVEKDGKAVQKALVIKSDKDLESAADILVSLKVQTDEIEDKRKEYVKPAQETINRINKDFKQLTEPRLGFMDMLKDAILSYTSERYKNLKDKEKELQREMKDRSLVLDNGSSKIVTQHGEVRFRKKTELKITNYSKIPDEFWVLDEKALTGALEAGEEVPGAKIAVEPIGSLAIYKDKD